MQDRYTGDIGDFGKFGLLRALCGESKMLGVVWYLTVHPEANSDGKHTGYLLGRNDEFERCDKDLFQKLKKLVEENRSVEAIKTSAVLPANTIFYASPLSLDAATIKDRLASRNKWILDALKETANAEIVFVDPDNGIECASVSKTAPKKGPKYAFWDEISEFANRNQSVVVYHHLNRSCPHDAQLKALRDKFAENMPAGFTVSAVVFNRIIRRAYFIAVAPRHKSYIEEQLKKFMETNWRTHFTQIA